MYDSKNYWKEIVTIKTRSLKRDINVILNEIPTRQTSVGQVRLAKNARFRMSRKKYFLKPLLII